MYTVVKKHICLEANCLSGLRIISLCKPFLFLPSQETNIALGAQYVEYENNLHQIKYLENRKPNKFS